MGSREAQITVDVHNQSAISYEQFQSHEELQVLRAIVAREAGIDELLQYCCSFEDDVGIELLEAVLRVRQLSLNVIDAVAGWRRRMVAKKPFLWRNVNYLLKMTSDLDFLSSGLDQSMSMLWQLELPEEDDLPVLLDSTAFGASVSVDLPSKIRLAERFLLLEEQRFGKLTKVQAAALDQRLKELVQKEAEFASKSRFGQLKGPSSPEKISSESL
ncbi:TPA: hypothetical protein N0F65_004936 [Lagenidium giganteum]|uniref:Uncharacterized protein n=1 Tax=Lagenidium giganteum TaxID=4803 RepID=A0AAV2YYI0_9STRA|nr:TPA: hypothetical protein N0F65_004936 [Lagenidium giganteum]